MREISLRDIAERTKISLRYLEAMEADRFDLLPAPVFAKGFLREYARYVGPVAGRGGQSLPLGAAIREERRAEVPGSDTKVRARPQAGSTPATPPVRRTWSCGLLLALAGLRLLVLVAPSPPGCAGPPRTTSRPRRPPGAADRGAVRRAPAAGSPPPARAAPAAAAAERADRRCRSTSPRTAGWRR